MDWKLELVLIPVSDVDRAKAFYTESVGFNLDVDTSPTEGFRVVQMSPPGSACSITIGTGLTDAAPGVVPGHAPGRQRHRGRTRRARGARGGGQRDPALRSCEGGVDSWPGSEPH